MFVRFIENFARFTDWIYGHVPNDLFRAWMSNFVLYNHYSKIGGLQTLLFDIEKDPQERTNIAAENPEIVKELLEDVERYKMDIPRAAPYWMITKNWIDTFITGMVSNRMYSFGPPIGSFGCYDYIIIIHNLC